MIRTFKKIALLSAAIALIPAIAGAQQSGTPKNSTTSPPKGSTNSPGAAPSASEQGLAAPGLKKTTTNDNSPTLKNQIDLEKKQRR